MNAPSDGAIVISHCADCNQRKPSVRAILRWYMPDAFIAFVLGGIAGSVIDACIYR